MRRCGAWAIAITRQGWQPEGVPERLPTRGNGFRVRGSRFRVEDRDIERFERFGSGNSLMRRRVGVAVDKQDGFPNDDY